MVSELQNYSEQAIQATKYIGQGFIITLQTLKSRRKVAMGMIWIC